MHRVAAARLATSSLPALPPPATPPRLSSISFVASNRPAFSSSQLEPRSAPIVWRNDLHTDELRRRKPTRSRFYSSEAAVMSSTGDQSKAAEATSSTDRKDALPPLSAHEFRVFNRMAEQMDAYHNHFRSTWNVLYNACKANKRPSGMTLNQFITTGLSFADHLTAHHTIEERYFFPMLAPRMPEFDPKNGDLVKQHEKIHHGLEEFQDYLLSCKRGEEDFAMEGLKSRMDSWGDVLWSHLDEEVRQLGAERMRLFWSREEMMRMPM